MSVLRSRGRQAVGALALMMAAGCTASDEAAPHAGSSTAPATPAPSTSESAAPEATAGGTATGAGSTLGPDAPAPGACYDLSLEEVTDPTSDHPPVPCGEEHSTRTIHVGRLDTVVDGHLLAVDSRHAQEQVVRSCRRRFVRHVGGDREARALSRLQVVWFSPTLEQSDRGATWFRCDVVLLGRAGALNPLPPRVAGILDRPGAGERVGLCGTAAPGTPDFERVVCAEPHTWKALSTVRLADGRYPGVAALRRAGGSTCRDRVRRVSDNPERFRYGWEWPTREQWQAGQRFGYCWAPD